MDEFDFNGVGNTENEPAVGADEVKTEEIFENGAGEAAAKEFVQAEEEINAAAAQFNESVSEAEQEINEAAESFETPAENEDFAGSEAPAETETPVESEAPADDGRDVYSSASAQQAVNQSAAGGYTQGQPFGGQAQPNGNYNPYGNVNQNYQNPGYNPYRNPAQGYVNPGYQNRQYNPNGAPYYGANQGYQQGYQQQGYPGAVYQNPAYQGSYAGYQNNNVQPAENQEPAPAPAKKRGKSIFIAIICLVLVFALLGGVAAMVKHTRNKNQNGNSSFSSSDSENGKNTGSGNAVIPLHPASSNSKALTVEQIAAKARESCVGVLVYYKKAYSSSAAGQGTGILAIEEGEYTYIITCAHVIDEAGISAKVQLEDGTSYDADIVGFDTRTDVGVVRIKANGLKLAEFGDSTQLMVGASVYAVGNPGGVEFFGSFTDGIVSAIDRPIDSEIGYTMNCIQHTAAINPGNSGGALVNVMGQVIGVNSQKIASAEYEGMGFAIPINQAVDIAEDLINHGYVPDRAKLGITYYSVGASQQYSMIAQFNQLPAGTLIIDTISEDSSLYGTEAQQYDMIIAVDGEELTTADVLLEKIDNGKVGDKHTLTLCRVNSNYTLEKFDVEITLVEDKGGSVAQEATTNYYPFFDFGF